MQRSVATIHPVKLLGSRAGAYVRELRLYQWIKNFFVFAPIFFAFELFEWVSLRTAFQAFVSFCFVASALYVLNDVVDAEKDALHPVKRFRPIAAGQLPISHGLVAAGLLACAGLLLAAGINRRCLGIVVAYGLLNVAYSYRLKNVAILDVFCISMGFVLRVIMGGWATGTPLSQWIVVTTFLLALFLALGKRRDDFVLHLRGSDVREAVEGYNLQLLDTSMGVVAAVTIVAYLMYTLSPGVMERVGSEYLYVTVAPVLLGLFRYMQLAFVFQRSGSPTAVVLHDRVVQLSLVVWLALFFLILYM